MMKKNIGNNLIGLALAGAIGGMMMEVMGKMFGTEEKIPKYFVKEMTEGIIAGLAEHFEHKIIDYQERLKTAEKRINDLEIDLENKGDEITRLETLLTETKNKGKKK